ncbi:hypothetical protein L228DRAFT_153582 [Xylona heveae TC161]|uniref:ML-like domain-containing protein n=1 Tax=Xylona heveae (strain CBS 132557 / TC161) TaxID=1328760 RepID=A0A165GQ74_XYLHT|nr:hypothetical protein L228DRAFT_153582 [Xylona heveae TC161]KZF22462.1 hypothetical protein L228DRAFT_153582 [Xylona heveae TC161]
MDRPGRSEERVHRPRMTIADTVEHAPGKDQNRGHVDRNWRHLPRSIPSHLSLFLIVFVLFLLIGPSAGAFITFDNCLNPNIQNSDQLQFVPLHVYASFNRSAPSHHLNFTVYGNVTGLANTDQKYPAPNDPQWNNPNDTVGKIVDLSVSNNKYSTLFAEFRMLSYMPYQAKPSKFCDSVVRGQCPLGPAFYANTSDPLELRAISVAHDFYSSFAFTTLIPTLRATSGDASNAVLTCISANITPALGASLSNLLRFLPLVVLILVGIATAFAAIWSPWGSTDLFRWTSNYGRDADLLRLVTPGFGDCLQYIQFVVLTGGLSLSYPGYYQPVISQVSWSTLMFNESFVSHGNGTQSIVDGIYVYNSTYGLDRLSQLVGMTSVEDIWAGMVIWLLVILASMIVLIQLWFMLRWCLRLLSNAHEEDLRRKNLPLTVGNVIRIVFNYFLLPIVSLSMFQLVVSTKSPAYTVALAALLILALVGFAGWLLYLIARTRPRSYLFDDLPTVLLYGPLYNTYSDDKAPFALIPVLLTFIRGIAIGAIQPSGIAQLVLLAICEVIFILTLHAFRPFHSPTSMNAYHTFFAVIRLVATLLSVAFVPSLGVTEGPKGWIGYVILLIHAIVLVFCFCLNAVQTLVEVGARVAGAGGEEGVGGGVARGGLVKVFGMRQLSRRLPRHEAVRHSSMTSDADILGPDRTSKSFQMNETRTRSLSGSSAMLLKRPAIIDGTGTGYDMVSPPGASHSHTGSGSAPYTPSTPGAGSTFSSLPSANVTAGPSTRGVGLALKTGENSDPYYRPPRMRRPTLEAYSPGARSRGSWASGDWANKTWGMTDPDAADVVDNFEGPSVSGRGTPVPAYLGSQRDPPDPLATDSRRPRTDYAVREVDFYYGVRGPALSNQPTRRLKTGPADPTGPVSSAAGWFKRLIGGKTKDKAKGFEVVRSSRAPPVMEPPSPQSLHDADVAEDSEPYRDNPSVLPTVGAEAHGTTALDDGSVSPIEDDGEPGSEERSPLVSDDDAVSSLGPDEHFANDDAPHPETVSNLPPSLPTIETGAGINLPTRAGSKASSRFSGRSPPSVPRKSSRRHSAGRFPTSTDPNSTNRLSTIEISPPPSPEMVHRSGSTSEPPEQSHNLRPSTASSGHLPFGSEPSSASGRRFSAGGDSTASSMLAARRSLSAADEATRVDRPGAELHHASLHRLAPHTQSDRPTSMGYVQQHRTNVHMIAPGYQPHVGSTAEVVDMPKRRSMSSDGKGRGTSEGVGS